MADFLKSHHEEIISMCIEEFDAEKYAQTLFDEGMERGLQEGMERGLQEGTERGLQEGMERGLSTGLTNMLKGMLVSFKEEQLPLESAYRFIRRNPECQSMSFEEIRDIWDGLS